MREDQSGWPGGPAWHAKVRRMKLADEEITELAAFCARRFPGQTEQAQLTAAAHVAYLPDPDPVLAWTDILRSAQAAGALPLLARALARSAPADRNLQEACAVLVAGSPRPSRWGAVAAGMTVLLALGLGLGWWWGEATAPRVAATSAPVTPTVAAIAAAPAPASASPTVSGTPPAAPSASPLAAPPPAAASAVAAPTAAITTPSASAPCASLGGPIVGYWYAGARAPGAQGDVITLDRDARVRADYPRAENGHNARAAERCVLSRGMRVRLNHAPIDASTGHYWVPYGPADHVE